MKTLILAAGEPQRSFVPITSFEFETFEIRVRKVFLPSPWFQGHGWMCSRLGARPVAPAALSSRRARAFAPEPVPKWAREPGQTAPWSQK